MKTVAWHDNDQLVIEINAAAQTLSLPFKESLELLVGMGLAHAACRTPERSTRRAVPRVRPRTLEVGWLLCLDGQSEDVIAAGLLHDVLEKTGTTSAELACLFGTRIVRLVESVSDDPSVTDYESRKRELGHRVAQAGPDTRAVFAADRIAKVRELALLPAQSLREPTVRVKLAHYRESLKMLRRGAGEPSLVHLLDTEVQQVVARTGTTRTRR